VNDDFRQFILPHRPLCSTDPWMNCRKIVTATQLQKETWLATALQKPGPFWLHVIALLFLFSFCAS
jgi:hypothetical protein